MKILLKIMTLHKLVNMIAPTTAWNGGCKMIAPITAWNGGCKKASTCGNMQDKPTQNKAFSDSLGQEYLHVVIETWIFFLGSFNQTTNIHDFSQFECLSLY